MDDSYLSWNDFDQIKKYISILLNIKVEWKQIQGTMIDTNEFLYDSDKYHIFLSCRKNNSFGFGICNKELMETIINETIKYNNNYKEYVFDKLHCKFNLN